MPASHHHEHADSGNHHHGAACHSSQVAGGDQITRGDSAETDECGCDHNRQPLDFAGEASSEPALIAGHSHPNCVGLCSLCVATTLLATSDLPDALRVGLVCDAFLLPGGHLAWPWQSLPGGISPRGPPATA